MTSLKTQRKIQQKILEPKFNKHFESYMYSKPATLYRTAKVHKLKEDEVLDKPTFRSIVSNIGKYKKLPS